MSLTNHEDSKAFINACKNLKQDFSSKIVEVKKIVKASKISTVNLPSYLDSELLTLDRSLYQGLLNLKENDNQLVCMVGTHYFTYDRLRVTQIFTPPQFLGNKIKQLTQKDFFINENDSWFNLLFMYAYRQIFQEQFTLNAWLLRAMEGRGLNIDLTIGNSSNPYNICVSPEIANELIADNFLRNICNTILSIIDKHKHCESLERRFKDASLLYKELDSKLKSPQRFGLKTWNEIRGQWNITDRNLHSYENQLKAVQEHIRTILRLPNWLVPEVKTKEVIPVLFTMIQSAIFYLNFYNAKAWHTITAEDKGVPYGLTLLTYRPLQRNELVQFQSVVNEIKEQQHSISQKLLTKKSYIEYKYKLSKNFKKRKNSLRNIFWESVIRHKLIPPHTFMAFVRLIEVAAECKVDNQFAKVAFVLSQSSYLSSVRFVKILKEQFKPNQTFYDLLKNNKDIIREMLQKQIREDYKVIDEIRKDYEKDRWKHMDSFLPYDLLNCESLTTQSVVGQSAKNYLTDNWGYPEPNEGFHLLDLDARFVYPNDSFTNPEDYVRRSELGTIGIFEEGGPPSGGYGLESYFALSKEIPRFVAGVLNGKGDATLIADGYVKAIYYHGDWEFYDRQLAKASINNHIDTKNNALLELLLTTAETLSHTYRKGAMFVVTDLDSANKEYCQKRINKYFIPMMSMERKIPFSLLLNSSRPNESLKQLLSIAQMDGCCILSNDGYILGYGRQLAISPEQISDKYQEILGELQKKMVQPGARRWSAAFLSKLEPKWFVLVVSCSGAVSLFKNLEIIQVYPNKELQS